MCLKYYCVFLYALVGLVKENTLNKMHVRYKQFQNGHRLCLSVYSVSLNQGHNRIIRACVDFIYPVLFVNVINLTLSILLI